MNQLVLDLQPVQDYRTIPLTQGQVTVVDAGDYDWLTQWKWFAQWNAKAKRFYVLRNLLPDSSGKAGAISMHRQILNAAKGVLVDHRDMDTLNNRRSNLRIATRLQNIHNRSAQANNRSGLKGVQLRADSGKWRARINVNGRVTSLGEFDNASDAHAAYCKKAQELHGEFFHP